jgi:hypothetical protein
MPSVDLESSTKTPRKGAKIPRGNKPDPGFEKAKLLADRGLISAKAMAKFQDKTWHKGEK